MVSRVASVRAAVPARRAALFPDLAPGQLEVLKLVALLCMCLAHGARAAGDDQYSWAVVVGSVSFPLYGFAVASVLAKDTAWRGERLCFGLFWFALAAQLTSSLVRTEPVANVLYQFMAAGAWVGADGHSTQRAWVLRCLALVVGLVSEFTLPGLAFVVLLTRALQRNSLAYGGAALLAYLVVCFIEFDWAGLTAFLLVWAVSFSGFSIPPVRRLYPAAYALHFLVIYLARLIK